MKVLSVNGQLISIGGLIEVSPPNTDICISPTELTNISYTGTTSAISVSGCTWNNTVVTDACDWIVTTSPVSPDPAGVNNNIQICENLTTSCRSGIVCYTPRVGETKCVTVCQSTGDTNIYVTPATISSISASGAYYSTSCIKVCGPTSNSVSVVSACDWIQVCNTPISPSATPGTSSCICVCSNAGAAREGYVTYTPTVGTAKTVCFCQVACITWHCVKYLETAYTSGGAIACASESIVSVPAMSVGDCYNVTFDWNLWTGFAKLQSACAILYCNTVVTNCCRIAVAGLDCSGSFNVNIKQGETWVACLYASTGYVDAEAGGTITISSITGVVGYYCRVANCTASIYASYNIPE